MENKRDITFDVMKGIGILLMLVAHWPKFPQWVHHSISSFLMPMYFMVAGYFSKPVVDCAKSLKKSALRLLLPYVFTQFLLIGWGAIQAFAKHDVGCVLKPALSLVWGSCDLIESSWGPIYVGPMWFLVALFWGKSFFELILNWVQSAWLLVICFLASVAAIAVHSFIPSPWCFFQGLSSLMFLALGWWIRNRRIPNWIICLALLCWPLSMVFSSMEFADLHYQIFPLDVMGACGGTLGLWWLSRQLVKIKWLAKPLSWCGVYSLVILCFHNFEWFSAVPYSIIAHVPVDLDGNGMVVFRYLFVIGSVVLVTKLPYVCYVYGVKHFNSNRK